MNPDVEKDGGGSGWQQQWPMYFTLAGVAAGSLFLSSQEDYGREISMLEFLTVVLESGRVEFLKIEDGSTVRVFLRSNATSFGKPISPGNLDPTSDLSGAKNSLFFAIGSVESFERSLHEAQTEHGVARKDMVPVYYTRTQSWSTPIINLAPTVAMVGLCLLMMRQRPAASGTAGLPSDLFKAGRAISASDSAAATAGRGADRVTFHDVAGMADAKTEVMEFVHFLKDPARFRALGAKIPKGALLCGPPGTGKTLLARAVAGEAGVPFFSMSGSDFVEMYVGVGASRVRDLFAQAKKAAPCIIFIDEIDA
eukprot:CAMPEP_0172174294 /NCGR_PEP_ID=MMETSP1050-20130122/13570_1 /TAXON_ID=233186 /ORGANISM="Cryptomonas curvata, Strain CCAP979/52" /LENGTH=309 /DNA_ID=CAMNT_0012846225 /DNA_START=290 /DNA_END=1216 /DNA_ORIENTATION=+